MADDPVREGEVFEGPSKTITDAHFLFFSALTGDVHPIHHDVEYASRTWFGKPIAHGLLLTALTALGATNKRKRGGSFIFVEQGSRFLKPALVGDTVYPRLVVERLWEEDGRRFCRLKTSITNQHGDLLMEGFHVYRVFPNPPSRESTP